MAPGSRQFPVMSPDPDVRRRPDSSARMVAPQPMLARVWWLPLLLLVALASAAYVVGGRPRPAAQTSGLVFALGADARGLLWLETRQTDPAAGGSIFTLPGDGGPPRCVYPAEHVTDLAPAGERVLALEVDAEGKTGSLVDVPRAGGAAQQLFVGLPRPKGLVADGRSAYWTEALPATMPHVWHIPALGPKVLVRSAALSGNATAGLLAVTEGSDAGFTGKLLGVVGERFYWIDFIHAAGGPGWSVARAVPLGGGTVQAVRSDPGLQTGFLDRGALYWTAPSEDAGDPLAFCCVRRASPPDAAAVTLTDWLWPGGTLCEAGGRVYYGSLDGVWAVPERLAKPRRLEPVGHGTGLVAGRAGVVYEVVGGAKGSLITGRAVAPTARLRAAWRAISRR